MTMRLIFTTTVAMLLWAATFAHAEDSPLADAAESKNFKAVGQLLEKKVDVNAAQNDGMTALHWAAYHDNADAAKELLAAGADANAANRYGFTPLSVACTNGSAKIVELLLEDKADPNAQLAGGETCLMTAARTGRVEPVTSLIAHGADVNAKERKGQTALMWAAAEGNTDVCELLVKSGADLHASVPSGFTAFFFAVREGKAATVFKLLEAGIKIDELMRPERPASGVRGKSSNALILATENGHFELAAALLDAGADPNAAPAGQTALHVISGVRKPIRGDGDPPPIGSGKLSSLDFVRKLVACKADVNARFERGTSGKGKFNTTGSTPFLLAARASDIPLMKLLLELGADPNIPNADQCTPLLAAAGVGALGDGDESAGTDDEALETVKLLIELGADVNAVDNNGETAIHGASYQDRANLVEYFADHGADIKIWNQKNKWGWTPLDIATGHRPGNFRPEPATLAVLDKIMPPEARKPTAEKPTADYGK
jgi:ankyrin repeat protein